MTTGSVVLDAAKLPGGTVADRRVMHRHLQTQDLYDDWQAGRLPSDLIVEDRLEVFVRSPEFISASFGNRATSLPSIDVGVDLTFDSRGRVDSYWIGEDSPFFDLGIDWRASGDEASGKGGDGVWGHWLFPPVFPDEMDFDLARRQFLEKLGYREHMPQFQKYYADETLWLAFAHTSEPGEWFDNLADFSSQVEINTRLALANPPRSVYDIAPIPVPLPFALLVGGFGALALVSCRRQTSRPQRS